MASPKPQSTSAAVHIRCADREHRLTPGSYTIGRHQSCNIVLDSALISRRHAELAVTRLFVTLRDLGSSNGVYVNGERVVESAVLKSGDRIILGDQVLDVEMAAGPVSGTIAVAAKRGAAQRFELSDVDEDDDLPLSDLSAPGTGQVDFFEFVGRVVDRVLSAGRFDEAATMLQSQMNRMLAEARSGRSIPPAHREASLRYAILLAAGARNGRWVDYALDLLCACSTVPSQELCDDLEEAVARLGAVDTERLVRYLGVVEKLTDPMERLRGTTLARKLGYVTRRSR